MGTARVRLKKSAVLFAIPEQAQRGLGESRETYISLARVKVTYSNNLNCTRRSTVLYAVPGTGT